MAQIETWLNQDMLEAVKVKYIDGNVFSQDNAGNLIGVILKRGEENYSGGGTVSASVIRADGVTVAVSGALSGNLATVVLPQAAYYVPGALSIVIKLTVSGEVTTIGAVVANVYQSSTDTVIDPGTIIPDINTLIAAIDAAVASIPADYSGLWEAVAPTFSSSANYVPGQIVTYDGGLYKFITTHSGTWSSSDAVAVSLGGEAIGALDVKKQAIVVDGDTYVLDTDATFEQGTFVSSGDQSSTTWIRTPKANKIQNDFVIYNPYRLQFAVASFYGNKFVGWLSVGSESVDGGVIYRDQIAKVYRETGYEYRIRVAKYLASGNLTPGMNTLKIFKRHYEENSGAYRTPFNLAVGNGAVLNTGSIVSDANYRYTDNIKLNAGETIHFEYAGPSNLVALSKWSPSSDGSSPVFSYNSALISGDTEYHVAEYTAESDMYVRISTMIYPVNSKPYTNADELVSSIFIFRAENYYDKTSPLYGKTITLIGDSLAHGSICGTGAVWLQRLALKHNMTAHNIGINGNAVTKGYGTGTAMCERYTSIDDSDYIVVEGGANDKGGGAPIGEFWSDAQNFVMNTDKTTFKGALNTIISGLRDMYPKAKLLFLTDYNRYPSKLHQYPDAMKEVCMMRSVPCFDDFSDSGIAVCEDGLKDWQDEGIWLGTSANYHFTPEAYRDVLLPKYENLLEHM